MGADDGGLVLCSWPHGGQPSRPFVYSNEVWTGIEYQVAAHLIFLGETEKGLEIIRTVRNRYDGESAIRSTSMNADIGMHGPCRVTVCSRH